MSHLVRAAIAVALLVLPTAALAKKAPWVVIDDPGELFSTYQFTETEAATIQKQLKRTSWASVLQYGNEGGWPDTFDDLEERTSSPDMLKQFHAQKVATFGDEGQEKVLLLIPTAHNKHLPADWQSSDDLFVVIAAHAVHEVKKY